MNDRSARLLLSLNPTRAASCLSTDKPTPSPFKSTVGNGGKNKVDYDPVIRNFATKMEVSHPLGGEGKSGSLQSIGQLQQ